MFCASAFSVLPEASRPAKEESEAAEPVAAYDDDVPF